MMRMLSKIVPFLLTLFLGIQAVRLADCVSHQFYLPAEIELIDANDEVTLAEFPRGVRITYDGFFPDSAKEPSPELRFLIYNGSPKELTCFGDSGRCVAPAVRVRGLDASSSDCMNGVPIYTIKPDEAAELVVFADDFNILPGRSEQVVIGYEFYGPDNGSDQYFAQPFVLPAEFRKAVSTHLKEIRDLEAGIY